jgi:hypothetical protein
MALPGLQFRYKDMFMSISKAWQQRMSQADKKMARTFRLGTIHV